MAFDSISTGSLNNDPGGAEASTLSRFSDGGNGFRRIEFRLRLFDPFNFSKTQKETGKK